MRIVKTMHGSWLSNTWLIADREGGHAVLVDTGGPTGPILEAIEEWGVTLTHVLCTHHHYDHVAHNGDYKSRFGCPVCGGRAERELFGGGLDTELTDGDELQAGDLRIRALHLPGHTSGQLGFLINEERVFTGDTLFRRSIGGTRGPGHTSFEDLQHSIMEVLMKLPMDTVVHPGHMQPSTIREEWEANPFVRFWRGIENHEEVPCTAFGQPATLLFSCDDYDGGTKHQVRFEDGRSDIVPGSKVRLTDA